MRKATVHTLGCRLNEAESQMIREQLAVSGYAVVPFGEKADLGILNTCTVTREADKKCRKLIRQFIRTNPEAFVAVVGCYSQMGAKAIASIGGVDLIIGNQEKMSVLDYVSHGKNPQPVIVREKIDRTDFSMRFVGDLPYGKRANLKIQDGCDFLCSFCIIPFARGRARSRDWENLLAEGEAMVRKGIQEVVLTGVNIGTYSSEGHQIVDLVDALNRITGITRIRISSIEPTTVPLDLFDRMADPDHALLPYLHLPLQAGCDRTLERMRRKYSCADYRQFVQEAVRRVPGLCLGSDILVGFDGETAEDFAETCAFFEDLPFAYTHVFPYSERDGTLARKKEDFSVPVPERNRRCTFLRRLSASKQHAFMEAHLGSEAIVLLEDRREDGFPGYTEDYIRTFFPAPADVDWSNCRVRVRLEQIEADFMSGTILEFIDSPRTIDAEAKRPAIA